MVKHLISYLPAQIIPAFFAMLNLAMFTRLLSPEDYGFYALMVTSAMLLNALLGQWLLGGVMRYYSRYEEEGKGSELLNACGAYLWGTNALLAIAAFVYALISETALARAIIPLVIITFTVMTLQQLILRVHMTTLKSKRYTVQTVMQTSLSSILAIGLMFGVKPSPTLAIIGIILGYLPTLLQERKHFIPLLQPWLARQSDLHSILRFGGWSALSIAMFTAARRIGLFITVTLLGSASSGALNAAQSLVEQTLAMVFTLVAMAAHPMTVKTQELQDHTQLEAQLRKNFIWIVGLGLPSTIGFMIIGDTLVGLVLGSKLHTEVQDLLPWLCLGAFFSGFRNHYLNHSFFLAHKNHYLLGLSLVALILGTLLTWQFIGLWGLTGAAIALCLMELILGLTTILLTRYATVMVYPLPAFLVIVFATITMGAGLMSINVDNPILQITLQVLLGIILYSAVLLICNFENCRQLILCRVKK